MSFRVFIETSSLQYRRSIKVLSKVHQLEHLQELSRCERIVSVRCRKALRGDVHRPP